MTVRVPSWFVSHLWSTNNTNGADASLIRQDARMDVQSLRLCSCSLYAKIRSNFGNLAIGLNYLVIKLPSASYKVTSPNGVT